MSIWGLRKLQAWKPLPDIQFPYHCPADGYNPNGSDYRKNIVPTSGVTIARAAEEEVHHRC